jgi:hypothetical protein
LNGHNSKPNERKKADGALSTLGDPMTMPRLTFPTNRVVLCFTGAALFLLACAFPAIGTCSRDPAPVINWFDNATLVFAGGLGIFALQVGWFANVGLVANLATALRGRPIARWRLVLHAGPLVIGVLTLQPALGMELPHNEAWSEPICRLGAGFWLWLAAHVAILASAIMRHRDM